MVEYPQERSKTTTVYAGVTWDDIVGAAALAIGLSKKGFRVYIDLPVKEEFNNLRIVRSYAVGIQPRNGVVFSSSTSMIYSKVKKMGYVFRYDESGRGEILMKISTVNSVAEVVREYLATINVDVEIPQQILDDIIAMNNGGINKLSKIGRVIYGIHKIKNNDKNVRLLLYNYAYNSILTKNLRLPQELLTLYSEYEKALKIVEELVKEGRYMTIEPYKVAIISSKYSDEFVSSNVEYLRPFVSDILSQLCRQSNPAFVVYEDYSNVHEVRVCVKYSTSIVKVVDSIPKDLVEKLNIVTAPTSVTIEFLNPQEATLDNALNLVNQMISKLSSGTSRE